LIKSSAFLLFKTFSSTSHKATTSRLGTESAAMVLDHPMPFTPIVATRKVSVLKILLLAKIFEVINAPEARAVFLIKILRLFM
jgi:hypothetical protein